MSPALPCHRTAYYPVADWFISDTTRAHRMHTTYLIPHASCARRLPSVVVVSFAELKQSMEKAYGDLASSGVFSTASSDA